MKKAKTLLVLTALMLTLIIPNIALAADTPAGTTSSTSSDLQEGLTIDEAVDMALAASKTIKKAQNTIESSEESLQIAGTNLKYIPVGPTSSSAISVYVGALSADINLTMAKKSKSAAEDAIVYSVFSSYIDVLKSIEALDLARSNLAKSQTELNIARISYQLGTISQYERDSKESAFKTAQASLASAENSVATKYQAFNKLVGLNPEERPVLTEKPAYSKLVTDGPEAQALRAVDQSPTIWNAEQAITLAQVQVDLFDFTNQNSSYKAKTLAVDSARLTADDAKESLKQSVRSLYSSINSLEEQIGSAETALDVAEKALKITQVKYDIGMATKLELQTARLAVEQARQTLNTYIYSHELAKIAYEKPWAAS